MEGPDQIDPNKPIDSVLAGLVADIAARDRGFALNLVRDAGTGGTTFEVKESLAPLDTYEAPPKRRAHKFGDLRGLREYAERHTDKSKAVIFFNDTDVTLCLNEMPEAGQRELAVLTFERSQDHRDWDQVINKAPIDHKALLKFLILHAHGLEDPTVIGAMRTIKVDTNVKMGSDIKDSGENFAIVVEVNKGEGLLTFPKGFDIRVPILRLDGPTEEVSFHVRLEVEMPTEPKMPVKFSLLCAEWSRGLTARIDAEIEALRTEMDGWLIVRGQHHQTDRPIGRPKH